MLIEELAAYWDRQPCNIGHGVAALGSREWSDQVTHRKYFVEPHILRFAQFWKWHGKDVLEIGCGIGTDTLQFIASGVSHIDAIDASYESVSLAAQRAGSQTVATFRHANAEEYLPLGYYDLIYSFGVLHHTPNPELILASAHRRLKPQGELRIMVYAKWSIKNLMRQQPEAQAGCPLVKYYSAMEIISLLASCGFKVTDIRKAHIFPWKIAEYKRHEYVKRWPYSWMPKWFMKVLERLLGAHLLVVARKA